MKHYALGSPVTSLFVNDTFKKKLSVSVQFSSVSQSYLTLCDPMNHSTPGLPVHHQLLDLLKLKSIKSVMPSNHLILCRPLLLLPLIPPSIRVFSNESTLRMRWPKYWSFSFSISPSRMALFSSPCRFYYVAFSSVVHSIRFGLLSSVQLLSHI